MFIPTTQLAQAGSGSTWTNSFTETGASLANWTQVSGSWSVVSSAFHVDTTAGTAARLKYNTQQMPAYGSTWCFSADVQMESTNRQANAPIGLLVYWPGATTGSPTAELFTANGSSLEVRTELDATASLVASFLPSPTWALDAYSNLKIVGVGQSLTAVLDSKVVAVWTITNAFSGGTGFTGARFAGLIANNCNADFKNIRMDYIAYPS